MITAFFLVAGMGIGLGMGTVLQKFLVVKSVAKKGRHDFSWNGQDYTTTVTSATR
jgi:hypothetical protein